MNRADLAQIPRAEILEHPIYLHQRPPKSRHCIRIIRLMREVPFEGDRIGNFVWRAVDFGSNAQFARQCEEAVVEFRNRHGLQCERPSGTVSHGPDQLMAYKIKVELDASAADRDQRRRQPACGHVERGMPSMVYPWGAPKAILADDLLPEMQRGAGFFPRLIGNFGPVF